MHGARNAQCKAIGETFWEDKKQMLHTLFIFIIMCIVPPLISVILYERLRGYKLPNSKRAALYLIFAFIITVAGITALWVLGWGYQVWIPDTYGVMTGLTYILAYAAVSLASAVVIPHAICLLRKKAAEEEKEEKEHGCLTDSSERGDTGK